MNRPSESTWDAPTTVAGFATAAPNAVLIAYAGRQLNVHGPGSLLDIGCGAGRNAVPLARMGWDVVGTDLSPSMLKAAAAREGGQRLRLLRSAMDALPIRSRSTDLIIAHGIWNLARSGHEFRLAIAEAARVAGRGAALFVFTFSRHTLPASAVPIAGESFVYTDFSGAPQCFLTETQLLEELRAVGFLPDPALPLRELNRPAPGLRTAGSPVIYEGAFHSS